ncbi:zinc finger protein [Loa loa]|uniref:Zinc finger protein n=1 Tax=Loa loa TaxID=7209 RepID=A0A1I7VQR5_LOALO|nr:zinc finger protein [Loa loa]EFO26590.1 zinc finger protein [Loa loa]
MERTEVSELYCKKAPRIISRGRLRSANASVKKEKEYVKNDCEMDDEVGEGFVVRGGVMMRVADVNKEQWKPMKRFYIDVNQSQIYEHAEAHDGISLDDDAISSHVTVEVSALPGDGRMFHMCDNLPGVANEVESYPCRYCPNRIFLTSFGLERHTEMEHKMHLPEVMEEISRIHNEWRRREAFKTITKKRREALKKTRMLTEVVRRSQSLRFEDRSTDRHHTNALSCHICGLDLEANCKFMMNHFRAHRRNDELKRRLLASFGPSYVARCTCHQCHLVFVNEKNLMLHKESSHLRKRKYVCKWCGDMCLSVNELNEHKKDVHGIPCSRPEKSLFISTTSNSQKNAATLDVVAADGSSAEKQTLSGSGLTDISSGNCASLLNHNPCIAKCGECGLTTVKPSLLIRHMQRVHNKNCFSTIIEMKGLPNIRVDMDRGKVTWWCCNFSFEDKYRFIYHRKTCHQLVLEYNHLHNCAVDTRGQAITVHETDREFMNTGQTAQLINPDETQDDELYVLMAQENLEQGRKTALQEIRAGESIVEGAQQITLTAIEFMQLKQQVGENFDGAMQIFLVDDMNGAQQPSPNSGVEPSADFVANNDVLNSVLVTNTQMPPTDDKYYSGTHSAESESSVGNVPDPTEDKILQNDLPLPSQNLINVETSSSNLSIPTVTFSRGTLIDNSLKCHFQVQKSILNELTAIPTVAISHSAQQLHDNVAYSPTMLCPELDGVPRSAPGTFPSIIVINNKETISPPSSTGYCSIGGLKITRSFLERPSNRPTSVLNSIPTLLDLDRKDTLTTTAAKTMIDTSSLQHLSTTAVRDDAVSSYISQDTNSAVASVCNSTIYNLSLGESNKV